MTSRSITLTAISVILIILSISLATAATSDQDMVCAESISTLRSTCEGGEITADIVSGNCRSITCEGSTGNLEVLACDKPDESAPEYFEMYLQSTTGSGIDICLGGTCLDGWGFRRGGDYPICIEGESEPTPTPTPSSVIVADGFPVDHNYVFICQAGDFDATRFEWDFGDGIIETFENETRLPGYAYHSFASNGDFTVHCTMSNGVQSARGNTTVTVNSPAPKTGKEPWSNLLTVEKTGPSTFILSAEPVGVSRWTARNWWQLFAPNGSAIMATGEDPGEIDILQNYESLYGPGTLPDGTYGLEFLGQGVPEMERPVFYKDSYVPCNFSGGCGVGVKSVAVTIEKGEVDQDDPSENDTGDQTPPPDACIDSIGDLALRCEGGEVASDVTSGSCRSIACAGETGNLQILACDKPDGTSPEFFEMYLQSQTGFGVDVCLGGTCLDGWGFRRGTDYGMCTNEEESIPPGNDSDSQAATEPLPVDNTTSVMDEPIDENGRT